MKHNVKHLSVVLILLLSLFFMPVGQGVSKGRAQSAGPNLIINGNFEAGNTGFTTSYTFTAADIYATSSYDVLTDPRSAHRFATSYHDHTSGAGKMMAANGSTVPGTLAWSQTVPVDASSSYQFSAWISSWSPGSPSTLEITINGTLVGTFTAPLTAATWQLFTVNWDSGASTSAVIRIVDTNLTPDGNDFALDDLAMQQLLDCSTATPTSTSTSTPTGGPTNTPTMTPPSGPTNTPTMTPPSGPTNTPTNTPPSGPTNTPTNTPPSGSTNTPTMTPTSTAELGQLKLCTESASGVPKGTPFAFRVNSTRYNVQAGYCVLAGTYTMNTKITVQETIPAGFYVASIDVLPSGRLVSQDKTIGKVVAMIGTGVTEIVYKNRPVTTATPANTSTPRPTRTPTPTPGCSPNCTPTATPIPIGRSQICNEADGAGVSGLFTFRFNAKSRTVPVGSCSLIFSVNAGTLTITEDARAGFAVSDIYTIPADRLVSKDINNRTVTVTIVPGNASTQTIVVFVNRAVTTQAVPQGASYYSYVTQSHAVMAWLEPLPAVLSTNRKFQVARIS